jgi:hypothetical protein
MGMVRIWTAAGGGNRAESFEKQQEKLVDFSRQVA